jgi:hypothetical protein
MSWNSSARSANGNKNGARVMMALVLESQWRRVGMEDANDWSYLPIRVLHDFGVLRELNAGSGECVPAALQMTTCLAWNTSCSSSSK